MKGTLLVASNILLTVLPGTAGDWLTFIRQSHLESGVVWDQPVGHQGTSASELALRQGGSLLQLWAIRRADAADYLLDQKLVAADLPSATISIETGDPYPHAHRTRADQAFAVSVDVQGLPSDPEETGDAGSVLIEHYLAPSSSEGVAASPATAISGTPVSSGQLTSNGVTHLEFSSSVLPSNDPTQAMGEEHFVIHALPDQAIPQTQIASSKVQIWPVADGRITGIKSGDVIRNGTHPIELHLNNLYPSSTTYLQIYAGSPELGTEGRTVEGSILVLDQDSSEDRLIRIENWQQPFETNGPHTMEIVTITPFGSERLSFVEFVINRETSIRARFGLSDTATRDPDLLPVAR